MSGGGEVGRLGLFINCFHKGNRWNDMLANQAHRSSIELELLEGLQVK